MPANQDRIGERREQLPLVREKLLAVRRRIGIAHLVRVVASSLLVGLTVFVAFELVRLVVGPAWLFSEPGAVTGLLPASLVAVGVFLLGLLHVIRTLPSTEELALRAERHYRMAERLSSAMGVADKDCHSLLEWALLMDAESRAAEIEPSRLVPFTLPRSLRLLPVPLVLLGVLQLLPPAASVAAGREVGAEAQDSAAQTSSEAKVQVEQLARLVEEVAGREDDPYLTAVARSFRELAERLSADEVEAEELANELTRLGDHLERALGEEVAGGTEVFDNLPPTLAAAKAEQEARDAATSRSANAEDNAGDRGSDAGNQELEDMFRQLSFDFAPGVDEPSERESAAKAPGEVIGNSGGYANPDPEVLAEHEKRRQEAAMRAPGEAGEVPIGAAQESNEGAGDMAGEGTQPLERGATGRAEPASAEREAVELPGGDTSAGRRIEVELPPETVYSLVEEGSIGTNEWTRVRESARNSYSVGIINRDVVSRYFLPAGRFTEEESERTLGGEP